MSGMTLEGQVIDAVAVSDEEQFAVIVASRIYHADLLKAARKLGSIKALAEYLGVSDSTLSNWISLKAFPTLVIRWSGGKQRTNRKLANRWPDISRRLYEITGKTTEQLFPGFVRLSGLLDAPKVREETREISAGMMLAAPDPRTLPALPPPEREMDLAGAREQLTVAMKALTLRQREILKLRYGLGTEGGRTYSLNEVGRIFKISHMRVLAVEAQAIRKLQSTAAGALWPFAEALLNLQRCSSCYEPGHSFRRCGSCGAVICLNCIFERPRERESWDSLRCKMCPADAPVGRES